VPIHFESPLLHCFWISFKWHQSREGRLIVDSLPFGFGITAFTQEDAIRLLEENGLAQYFDEAREVIWTEVKEMSQLDQKHIVPNAGPMFFRGIWYPSLNTGFEPSGK
jgi:hypothetical protein